MADELLVITHIDLIPKFGPDGTPMRGPDGRPNMSESIKILEDYAAEVGSQPGVVRFELLQQIYRKNHFEMLTVFSSLDAYEAHRQTPLCRTFRERLHPQLGAPFDDRLHYLYAAD